MDKYLVQICSSCNTVCITSFIHEFVLCVEDSCEKKLVRPTTLREVEDICALFNKATNGSIIAKVVDN